VSPNLSMNGSERRRLPNLPMHHLFEGGDLSTK
jgi:hypothetical protein